MRSNKHQNTEQFGEQFDKTHKLKTVECVKIHSSEQFSLHCY